VDNNNYIIDDIYIELKTSSALILVLYSSIYYLISLPFYHAFKYSVTSIMSSYKRLRSSEISLFALLKTRSYSVDITGIYRMSNAI
jgi:hypothetical protein